MYLAVLTGCIFLLLLTVNLAVLTDCILLYPLTVYLAVPTDCASSCPCWLCILLCLLAVYRTVPTDSVSYCTYWLFILLCLLTLYLTVPNDYVSYCTYWLLILLFLLTLAYCTYWFCIKNFSYQKRFSNNLCFPVTLLMRSPGVKGYVDLLNGPMDRGWCMGYTCQERISTFYSIVAVDYIYEMAMTGTPPQVGSIKRLPQVRAVEGEPF